ERDASRREAAKTSRSRADCTLLAGGRANLEARAATRIDVVAERAYEVAVRRELGHAVIVGIADRDVAGDRIHAHAEDVGELPGTRAVRTGLTARRAAVAAAGIDAGAECPQEVAVGVVDVDAEVADIENQQVAAAGEPESGRIAKAWAAGAAAGRA